METPHHFNDNQPDDYEADSYGRIVEMLNDLKGRKVSSEHAMREAFSLEEEIAELEQKIANLEDDDSISERVSVHAKEISDLKDELDTKEGQAKWRHAIIKKLRKSIQKMKQGIMEQLKEQSQNTINSQ